MKRLYRWGSCLFVALILPFILSSAKAGTQENIEIIYTYLTENYGLNKAAVCGILSNIRSESNFNPEAIGDSGNAYGICQWNSRRQSLINYCERNGFESWKSLEGQLGYLVYELENNKKSVGTYLKNVPNTAQGAYDAAYYFCVYFEIPANRYVKGVTRGTNAVNIYWVNYGGTVASYTVSYHANGGKNAPAAQTKKEGIPLLLSTASPVRTGYSHAGWARSANASGVEFEPGDTYSDNKSVTLYAVWEKSLEAETEPDAVITANGKTYEYYSGAFTWDYANSFASIKGGYLASVRTQEELNAVSSLIEKSGGACWLGGRYTNGNWIWSTGESFSDDFAENNWASGYPIASYGANTNGRLAQDENGSWLDLKNETLTNAGFIVEYGETASESFPEYRITVSTSLNLREGPGTSYTSLGYLYPDMTIRVYETCPGSSYNWGWCISSAGSSGWCAMKIPDYMMEVNDEIDENGIIYTIEENEAHVTGYTMSADTLEIPAQYKTYPVTAVKENAFTKTPPGTIILPDTVTEIQPGAFPQDVRLMGAPGSRAHFYSVENGHPFTIIMPAGTLTLPAAVKEIHEGAFTGAGTIECIDLTETKVTSIPSGAFTNLSSLKAVLLPDSITFIAEDAFDAGASILFVVTPGSPTDECCQTLGFDVLAFTQ
ncbi:MAG: InlB B-repeat-containing protein [Clostridia bacterium]|nr:InlB B-repeat-containing protein [Clostridia bacterium]